MDLVDLVVITKDDSKEPSIDEKRFRLHVEPKGAGTGLGYVRLMERLVKFHEDYVERDEEELTPVSRAAVLAFTEHLISEEAGFKTPKAFLYALDFYSVSYGFRLGLRGDAKVSKVGRHVTPPRNRRERELTSSSRQCWSISKLWSTTRRGHWEIDWWRVG